MTKGISTGIYPAEREVLSGHFARFVTLRILFLPVPLFVLGYVAVSEPATWRRGALAGLALVLLSLSVVDLLNVRRARLRPRAPYVNLAVIGLVHPLIVFATGGLESPVLPLLPALSLGIGLFAPPSLTAPVVAGQLVLIAGMALVHLRGWIPGYLPDLLGGGAGSHSPTHTVLTALVLSLVVAGTAWAGNGLRVLFGEVVGRALSAKDEALAAHREQARTLTALSAEIAHELKNPLASVKGLAALVSKDVEGKAAERLLVLRRETDRMAEILEGFLNFSRPLTPLALEEVELGALVQGVAALHEGMARERGGQLVVEAPEPVFASCDPRKIQQVLINALQNALEAGGPGTAVEIHVGTDGRNARIEVRDRGQGLDAGLEARLFEPGVTTRPTGSGLGLTIARGLMRQHGGDLSLRPRIGGGAVAVLTLPPKGDRS